MLRRRRPLKNEAIQFSFDSFLDLVTNVVGIIIRLILVTPHRTLPMDCEGPCSQLPRIFHAAMFLMPPKLLLRHCRHNS